MVFTKKSISRFTKKLARTVRKGMNIGEKVVNTLDKASGGMLRSYVAGKTGGKSEAFLLGYKQLKNPIKHGLNLLEGNKQSTIEDVLKNSKYEKPFNKFKTGIDRMENEASKNGLITKLQENPQTNKALNVYNEGKNILYKK